MFKVEVWDTQSARADLLGHFVGLEAAKRVFDRAKLCRQSNEIARLSGPNGIICEIGDAFAPAKLT
jgi:hypothetical protein